MVDISGLQSTIFDPSIVNLFFSDNAADAEILGIEGDFIYVIENGMTISGAFSSLDTEITKSLVPTNDVVVGSDLAFAPGYQGKLGCKKRMGSVIRKYWSSSTQVTISDDSDSDIMEPNKAVQSRLSLYQFQIWNG